MIDIMEAIRVLDPNTTAGVSNNDIDKIHWHGNNSKNLTKEQIKAKYDELVEADKKLQYQRDRKSAYHSIPDQLDTIYHKGVAEWKKEIKAVKDKYPKPE